MSSINSTSRISDFVDNNVSERQRLAVDRTRQVQSLSPKRVPLGKSLSPLSDPRQTS